jgi:hypothetical protein
VRSERYDHYDHSPVEIVTLQPSQHGQAVWTCLEVPSLRSYSAQEVGSLQRIVAAPISGLKECAWHKLRINQTNNWASGVNISRLARDIAEHSLATTSGRANGAMGVQCPPTSPVTNLLSTTHETN